MGFDLGRGTSETLDGEEERVGAENAEEGAALDNASHLEMAFSVSFIVSSVHT